MLLTSSAEQLVTAGYGVAYAALLVLGGRLGDRYGRHRIFLGGLVGFVLASLACGLAPSAGFLIAARIVQGAAAALLIPQVLATFHHTLEGQRKARALALYGATSGIAAVVGQIVGGLLVSANIAGTTWRPIFPRDIDGSRSSEGGSSGTSPRASAFFFHNEGHGAEQHRNGDQQPGPQRPAQGVPFGQRRQQGGQRGREQHGAGQVDPERVRGAGGGHEACGHQQDDNPDRRVDQAHDGGHSRDQTGRRAAAPPPALRATVLDGQGEDEHERARETTKLINQNRRRRRAPDNSACTVPARQQPGSCTADSINPAADHHRNGILIARTHQLTRPNVRPARSPAYLNSITTAIPEQRLWCRWPITERDRADEPPTCRRAPADFERLNRSAAVRSKPLRLPVPRASS